MVINVVLGLINFGLDTPSRPRNVTVPVVTHWGETNKANPSLTHEVQIDESNVWLKCGAAKN